MTIQRITLINGIRDEVRAIEYYNMLFKLSNDPDEKHTIEHFLIEEIKHKKFLETMLRRYTDKKGQTHITNLLSM
jgi:rubrerythrin